MRALQNVQNLLRSEDNGRLMHIQLFAHHKKNYVMCIKLFAHHKEKKLHYVHRIVYHLLQESFPLKYKITSTCPLALSLYFKAKKKFYFEMKTSKCE